MKIISHKIRQFLKQENKYGVAYSCFIRNPSQRILLIEKFLRYIHIYRYGFKNIQCYENVIM